MIAKAGADDASITYAQAVEAALCYGWTRAAAVPADLQAALDAKPKAGAFFATLDGANRYAVLWRVQTAKKPETRARRIETLVSMLARGEKIHG